MKTLKHTMQLGTYVEVPISWMHLHIDPPTIILLISVAQTYMYTIAPLRVYAYT